MSESPHPDLVTYTADVSICSQICRLAVQEHQLSDAEDVHVDIEHAMENYDPWFVRIQPTMTVPVMKYDGTYIGDSKEILYFLADKHPKAGLYPEGQRDEIDAFIKLFYDNFMAIGIFTFGNLISRDEKLKQFVLHGKTDVTRDKLESLLENPELAEPAKAKLEEMKLRDFSLLADPQLLANVDQQIESLLKNLADKLADGRAFVAGLTYTLADVVATALLARVHFIKQTEMFAPGILEYWQRVQARPSFQDANVCANWEDTLMARQYEEFTSAG